MPLMVLFREYIFPNFIPQNNRFKNRLDAKPNAVVKHFVAFSERLPTYRNKLLGQHTCAIEIGWLGIIPITLGGAVKGASMTKLQMSCCSIINI